MDGPSQRIFFTAETECFMADPWQPLPKNFLYMIQEKTLLWMPYDFMDAL